MRKLPVLGKLHTHTHTHTVLYCKLEREKERESKRASEREREREREREFWHGISVLQRETEHLCTRQPCHGIGA